ncbi:MAG TPA: hypothetical protein VG269_23600 [Tepidisphaeraceae bacterium]|jgi:hypothetical protein|nr:hypothetical protein [Tepidisphaeraceae bacterium]
MLTFRAHFDGKAIVPDEPINLPKGTAVVVHVELIPSSNTLRGTPGPSLLRFAGAISPEDLRVMQEAIDEGRERDSRTGDGD